MHRAATTAAIAIAFSGDEVPDWVMLFPSGGAMPARDGRRFVMEPTDVLAVVAAFRQDGRRLPVDLEHSTQLRGARGLSAPAVGWIEAIEGREGALWARVAWTKRGATLLSSKAYRYISPTFFHDAEGRVLTLEGAGLTNNPALRLPAVARRHMSQEETPMNRDLLEALGLAEGASEADALAAARTLATATAAAEARAQLATARAAAPDAQLYVPRADFEAATARVQALEAVETARREADEEAAVGEAIAAGKITPIGRELHLASCRSMGAAAFRAAMAGQPVIAMASLQVTPAGAAGGAASGVALTHQQLAICKQMNMAPADYAAHLQREKDLVQ